MVKAIQKVMVLFMWQLVLASCQQTPTKSLNEEADVFGTDAVLVDTRDSFLYVSSHIQGSVNLVTSDYLILKNPRTKKRIMDPDLDQTIERLSRRGLSQTKKITLLSDQKNSTESKKWAWLLKQLGIENVQMITITEFKKAHPNPRYADPQRAEIWKLQQSSEMQQEFILKKSNECFVSWSEKNCTL